MPTATSCAELPAGTPSGVHQHVIGDQLLDVYCEMDVEGGGWALVVNSVGGLEGTVAFWQIPYAERFSSRGVASLAQNHYAGPLYPLARELRDEVVDTMGTPADVVRATVDGINPETMAFLAPVFVGGQDNVFLCHVGGGWGSLDYDADQAGANNCAADYLGVTQHYCSCWTYNLGSDADIPYEDAGWGPHMHSPDLTDSGLLSDGSGYSRVQRISRWARW